MIHYKNQYCEITIKEPDSRAERMAFYKDFAGAMALMRSLQTHIDQIKGSDYDDEEMAIQSHRKAVG